MRVRQPAFQAVANRALVSTYERISRLTVVYGNDIADRGEVFVTDRMHGHLLAVLRGQPTVLLPDAFGKNRSIFDAWSSRFECVHWADSVEEAVDFIGLRPGATSA
jgi:pyruvyl transferase EpsO